MEFLEFLRDFWKQKKIRFDLFETHSFGDGYIEIDNMTLDDASYVRKALYGYHRYIQTAVAINSDKESLEYDIILWPGFRDFNNMIVLEGKYLSTITLSEANDYDSGRLQIMEKIKEFDLKGVGRTDLTDYLKSYNPTTPIFNIIREKDPTS